MADADRLSPFSMAEIGRTRRLPPRQPNVGVGVGVAVGPAPMPKDVRATAQRPDPANHGLMGNAAMQADALTGRYMCGAEELIQEMSRTIDKLLEIEGRVANCAIRLTGNAGNSLMAGDLGLKGANGTPLGFFGEAQDRLQQMSVILEQVSSRLQQVEQFV